MKSLFILLFLIPSFSYAEEISGKSGEITVSERLTRVETKLDSMEKNMYHIGEEIAQLRRDMNEQNKQLRRDMSEDNKQLRQEMAQLREDINNQNNQLRKDMNSQFDRLVTIMTAIVLAFAAVVAATIGFAIWDRRTMIRPFETRVQKIEKELTKNHSHLNSLIEAFKALSNSDKELAHLLKRFNLL